MPSLSSRNYSRGGRKTNRHQAKQKRRNRGAFTFVGMQFMRCRVLLSEGQPLSQGRKDQPSHDTQATTSNASTRVACGTGCCRPHLCRKIFIVGSLVWEARHDTNGPTVMREGGLRMGGRYSRRTKTCKFCFPWTKTFNFYFGWTRTINYFAYFERFRSNIWKRNDKYQIPCENLNGIAQLLLRFNETVLHFLQMNENVQSLHVFVYLSTKRAFLRLASFRNIFDPVVSRVSE